MAIIESTFKKGSSGYRFAKLAEEQGYEVNIVVADLKPLKHDEAYSRFGFGVGLHEVAIEAIATDIAVDNKDHPFKITAVFADSGQFYGARYHYHRPSFANGVHVTGSKTTITEALRVLGGGPKARAEAKAKAEAKRSIEAARRADAVEKLTAAAQTEEVQRWLQSAADELYDAKKSIRSAIESIESRLAGAKEALEADRRAGTFETMDGRAVLDLSAAQKRYEDALDVAKRLEHLFGPLPFSAYDPQRYGLKAN
jgi:hypothetical protein